MINTGTTTCLKIYHDTAHKRFQIVGLLVRRLTPPTLFFLVALISAFAYLYARFRFKLIEEYQLHLINVDICHLSNRKAPNSSLEVIWAY
jgi:hypothetical protein